MNKLTEEQLWESSKGAWLEWIKFNPPPAKRDGTRLDEYQMKLFGLLVKDIHALDGKEVMIGAQGGGSWYASYPYKAKVVLAYTPNNLRVIFNREGVASEEEVMLFRIWPIQEYKLLTPEERKQRQVDEAIKKIELQRKSYINNIAMNIDKTLAANRDMARSISRNKKLIAEQKNHMEIIKQDKPVDTKTFFKSLEQIKKNKHVVWAAIDKNRIYFETDMLYGVSRLTGKVNKRQKLGRFAVMKNLSNNYGELYNLDYTHDNGHDHPFASGGEICFGDDAERFSFLAQTGRYYILIDSLINFLSIFPSDSGDPHIPHSEWLKERYEEIQSNPWRGNTFLWEYPTIETDENGHDLQCNVGIGKPCDCFKKKEEPKISQAVAGLPQAQPTPPGMITVNRIVDYYESALGGRPEPRVMPTIRNIAIGTALPEWKDEV